MPFPLTPSQTASNTPTPSITASVTPSITPSLTNCPGLTPTATYTPTQTITPTVTPTPEPTPTSTNTPTITNTATNTPTPSVTPSYPPLSGTGVNAAVYDLIKNDGTNKIYIAGAFSLYNGATQNRLVRINEDGSKDTGFDIGTGFNGIVFALAEDTSNNKVYAGGSFTTFTGTGLNRLLRLNSTGSRDTTFNIGTGCNGTVYDIKVQSDGKILVGGSFTQYSGENINRIMRLNTDGTRDTTFNVGTGISVAGAQVGPTRILIDSDQKVLLVGQFTGYNGTAVGHIVRLTSGGTLDTTFSSGTGFNSFTYGGISQQSDGKYIVAGDFTQYNGVSKLRAGRLNNDGTLDTTYNTMATGINNFVVASTIDSQNRAYIEGFFSLISGVSRNGIARLTSDGDLDTSYVVGTGFSPRPDYVNPAILIENSGSILYGNNSTSYSGQTIGRLLRTDTSGNSLII